MDKENNTGQTERHSPRSRRGRLGMILFFALALIIGFIMGKYWTVGTRPGAAPENAPQKQLWTCGMHPQVIQDHPGSCPICGMDLEPLTATPGSAAPGGNTSNAIYIDPVVVQNMGVRLAQVNQGPIQRTIRAVGYLEQPSPQVHDVNLRVSGWVEKLYADTEGMLIRKGAPLFDIYSPEIQVAIQELLTARHSAQALTQHGDEASRKTADVLVQAAGRKLEQWGLEPAQIEQLSKLEQAPPVISFLSPITGEVTEKMVVEGAMVKMGERALRLVDRSRLWLNAQVFSQDLPFIQMGQNISVTIEGIPGREFAGAVIFINPQVNPDTRTIEVRMALDNPELRLRPGMFASARIETNLAQMVLQVPREAVLDTGTRQIVFVALENGHFEPRQVQTGLSGDDGAVQVLSGLAPGETVVVSGQFMLDAESRTKEAIQKYLSDKLPGTAAPEAHPEHAH